jgi:DNA-binding response OmpR family regulator
MAGARLLIVEDDRLSREALRKIFARKGWHVTAVETLAEGLLQLDPPPDCLILDLMLPDGHGVEILRQIRANNLPTRAVVCTGMEDRTNLDLVTALNPAALLTKPVALDSICKAFDAPEC